MAYGKRLKNIYKDMDKDTTVSLSEAVSFLKKASKVKFDETLDIAMHLGVDTKKSDQQVRGSVTLPHGIGKTVRVAVFAPESFHESLKKAGADVFGDEALVEEVSKGRIDFDVCIATPDMMVHVGKLGKVLGPKGLMPNPKLGTVAKDPVAALANVKAGQVQFKAEKSGIVHAGLGRVSFSESSLVDNIKSFFAAVQKLKPVGLKGTYLKSVVLSTTMGPSLKIDMQSFNS